MAQTMRVAHDHIVQFYEKDSYICEVVEAHGGTVEVESPGKGLGSTFTILLPLEHAAFTIARTSKPEM